MNIPTGYRRVEKGEIVIPSDIYQDRSRPNELRPMSETHPTLVTPGDNIMGVRLWNSSSVGEEWQVIRKIETPVSPWTHISTLPPSDTWVFLLIHGYGGMGYMSDDKTWERCTGLFGTPFDPKGIQGWMEINGTPPKEPIMKQKKETAPIEVGDYDVKVEDGKLIVGYDDGEDGFDIEAEISKEVAHRLLKTPERRAVLDKEISDANAKLDDAEAKLENLSEERDSIDNGESIDGYDVIITPTGISFGCTDVSVEQVKQLVALLS